MTDELQLMPYEFHFMTEPTQSCLIHGTRPSESLLNEHSFSII
jgi:hypothetical protein